MNLSRKEQNIKFCTGVNREFVALLLSITKREGLSKYEVKNQKSHLLYMSN